MENINYSVMSQSAFAPANFETTEEYPGFFAERLPGSEGIQDIVSQSLTRHIDEKNDMFRLATGWKKGLREMMVTQTESVLEFLVKPSSEQAILGKVESLLQKYSLRKEVDHSSIKTLGELLETSPVIDDPELNMDVNTIMEKKGWPSLQDLRSQTSYLINLYKELGNKILEYENQLKLRLDKIDLLHKQVTSILQLKVNDTTEGLVAEMTKYIQKEVEEFNIEFYYKSLVFMYKRHLRLRDAIQLFTVGSCIPSEPVCAICLTDSISHTIVPCGHTFCTLCCRRMVHECSICRSKIQNRMKIYIS
jgi:hypothetical protein